MIGAAQLLGMGARAALVSTAILLMLHLLRGRPASERSLLASLATAALLLFPIQILLPPSPAAFEISLPATDIAKSAQPSSRTAFSGSDIAAWVYLSGIAAFLTRFGADLAALTILSRRSVPLRDERWVDALQAARDRLDVRRRISLRIAPAASAPISWGIVRPVVLIDPATALRPELASAVAAHEVSHIARHDWWRLLMAELAAIAFWFLPTAWLLRREARILSELAADDRALAMGVSEKDLASALIEIARSASGRLPRAANAATSAKGALTRRVSSLLDERRQRIACLQCVAVSLGVGIGVTGLAASVALASTQLSRISSPIMASSAALPLPFSTARRLGEVKLPFAAAKEAAHLRSKASPPAAVARAVADRLVAELPGSRGEARESAPYDPAPHVQLQLGPRIQVDPRVRLALHPAPEIVAHAVPLVESSADRRPDPEPPRSPLPSNHPI